MKPVPLALAALLATAGAAIGQDPAAPAPAVAPPPAAAPAAVRAVDADTLVADFTAFNDASLARLTAAAGRDLSPPVAAVVARLVADHTRLEAELRAVAGDRVPAPQAAGETGTVGAPEEGLAGGDVETALVDAQADALSAAMRNLTGYVESGDRPDLVAFASAALATLQEHQAALAGLSP